MKDIKGDGRTEDIPKLWRQFFNVNAVETRNLQNHNDGKGVSIQMKVAASLWPRLYKGSKQRLVELDDHSQDGRSHPMHVSCLKLARILFDDCRLDHDATVVAKQNGKAALLPCEAELRHPTGSH